MADEVELDFEKDLKDVLSKHGFDKRYSRFVIRCIDSYRETQQELVDDSTSNS